MGGACILATLKCVGSYKLILLTLMTLCSQADLDAMIEEGMERRRRQEEVMRERVRREEERRTRAVVSLQAAARGYFTRKKITPKLVALRERKRLEGERARRTAQAAIAIQAVWRGYRWVAEIVSI